MKILCWLFVLVWTATAAEGMEPSPPPAKVEAEGEVRVSLPKYTQLLEVAREKRRPAPARYAIGRSVVKVLVKEAKEHITAQVEVEIMIRSFEDEWTLVPILPSGVALTETTVNGQPVQLVQGAEGLVWSTNKAGTITMKLVYGVIPQRSEAGFLLPIPVPRAAATRLETVIPGLRLDVAVVPAANVQSQESVGKYTHTIASIPTTSAIMLSWRTLSKRPYVISRAHYQGKLVNKALLWTVDFEVEVFSGESITLPLMPVGLTLSDLRIDGESAAILEEKGNFATLLQGRGKRIVQVAFQVPVVEDKGPPRASLLIPKVPVSRFDLTLPGKKELKVMPISNVLTQMSEDPKNQETLATVYLPMSKQIIFTWVEAVPEDLKTQVRANASLYHSAYAEEGVLHVDATAIYEITHGETNTLALSLPTSAQVNRITAPAGGISDWAVSSSSNATSKRVNVFLDREVKGQFVLQIAFEHLLGAKSSEAVRVPLLRAVEVHRQRGMVALLAGPELVLKPDIEDGLSRVGENQLPALVRNLLKMSVTHTYKYIDPNPKLVVQAIAPERRQGKFDAQVDTLLSIGEVTLKGSATIQVDVKSGAISNLQLHLPKRVNVLGVTGPSLRSHKIRNEENRQAIDLEFTQEMEGQFRIEIHYEYIMAESVAELQVPTLSVDKAEVEHGRIAVEALTAVEVGASVADQLSTLDLNELPQQLVLKTTNPILLAYKYVHAEPPYQLTLKITRHQEVEVQVAAIEKAHYETLYTQDGLAVTTARFDVRNSRRQFLHLELPAKSRVWSVFVDGKAEKPARAGGHGEAVLIRMINSTSGFPVEIVYATPVAPMSQFGTLSGNLPGPDMVVTKSRWDLFLPVQHRYQKPDSNMTIVVQGNWVDPRRHGDSMARRTGGTHMGQPLRMSVPSQGWHLAFEKLYANQGKESAYFRVRYRVADSDWIGLSLSGAGVLLLWLGLLALVTQRVPMGHGLAGGCIVGGSGALVIAFGYLGTHADLAVTLAIFIALVLSLLSLGRWLRAWRRGRSEA